MAVRVMGVDPGLARCGAVVIDGDARRPRLVAEQLIRTPADQPVGQRLATIADDVGKLLVTWSPEVMAIEKLLFNINVQSAMIVAQAVGVILLAAARADVQVCEYTPTQVKSTVTGYGDADKAQVKFLIAAQLGRGSTASTARSADAADAAAVALCHLWRSGGVGGTGIGGHSTRLEAAVARAGPGAQVVQPARGGREDAS